MKRSAPRELRPLGPLLLCLAFAVSVRAARADLIPPSVEVCEKKQEGDPCKAPQGFGFGDDPELPGFCVKVHEERRNRDFLVCRHDATPPVKSSSPPEPSGAPSPPRPTASSPAPASAEISRGPPEIGARPSSCGCELGSAAPTWGAWLALGSVLLLSARRRSCASARHEYSLPHFHGSTR